MTAPIANAENWDRPVVSDIATMARRIAELEAERDRYWTALEHIVGVSSKYQHATSQIALAALATTEEDR